MITRPDMPHRENRVFRIALVASLVAHVVFAVFAIATYDLTRRAFHPNAPLRWRKPADEIVTISSALHFEKRAKPVPAARRTSKASKVVPPAPVQRVPVPVQRANRPMAKSVTADVRKPVLPRPVALRKPTAAPAKPTYAPRPTRDSGMQVASVGKTLKTTTTVNTVRKSSSHRPASSRSQLSGEQLAQIERDLAKTIARERSETNPLRTIPREPPAAPKHYRLQMQGASRNLRRGEGYYYPAKSWRANGLNYYYVSYEFTWPNGVYETGTVPWPIHFTPGADPFASGDPALVNRTPLPAPPPDYVPPGTLGKALRAYFPKLVFSDSDS